MNKQTTLPSQKKTNTPTLLHYAKGIGLGTTKNDCTGIRKSLRKQKPKSGQNVDDSEKPLK